MVTRKEPRLAVDMVEGLGSGGLGCQAVPEGTSFSDSGNLLGGSRREDCLLGKKGCQTILGISRKHCRFGCRPVRILSPRGSSNPAHSVDAMHIV